MALIEWGKGFGEKLGRMFGEIKGNYVRVSLGCGISKSGTLQKLRKYLRQVSISILVIASSYSYFGKFYSHDCKFLFLKLLYCKFFSYYYKLSSHFSKSCCKLLFFPCKSFYGLLYTCWVSNRARITLYFLGNDALLRTCKGFDIVLHECYPIVHIASLIACQLSMKSYYKYACYDHAWSICMSMF